MATRPSTKSTRPAAGEAQLIDLHAWLFVLREKWWIIALCFFGTLALAGTYLIRKVPVYTATTIVQVTEDADNVINIQDVAQDNFKSDIALKSVEGAMNSSSLLPRHTGPAPPPLVTRSGAPGPGNGRTKISVSPSLVAA